MGIIYSAYCGGRVKRVIETYDHYEFDCLNRQPRLVEKDAVRVIEVEILPEKKGRKV